LVQLIEVFFATFCKFKEKKAYLLKEDLNFTLQNQEP